MNCPNWAKSSRAGKPAYSGDLLVVAGDEGDSAFPELASPVLKNKLPGRVPLHDRAFAFLVTPKLPLSGRSEKLIG
jgi:hypothetical protein